MIIGPGDRGPGVSGSPGACLGWRVDAGLEGDKLGPLERLCRVLRRNMHNGVPSLADTACRVLAGPHERGHIPQRVDIVTERDSGSLGCILLRVGQIRFLLVEVLEKQVDHLCLEDVLGVILDAGACRQGATKVKVAAVLGVDPTPIFAIQLAARGEVLRDVAALLTGLDQLLLVIGSLVKHVQYLASCVVAKATTSLLISIELCGDGVFINGRRRRQLLPLVLGRISPAVALVARFQGTVCLLARHAFFTVSRRAEELAGGDAERWAVYNTSLAQGRHVSAGDVPGLHTIEDAVGTGFGSFQPRHVPDHVLAFGAALDEEVVSASETSSVRYRAQLGTSAALDDGLLPLVRQVDLTPSPAEHLGRRCSREQTSADIETVGKGARSCGRDARCELGR